MIVHVCVAVHPFASVRVNVYESAHNCDAMFVPCPFPGSGDHAYVSVPVPPDTSVVIVPSQTPLQSISVATPEIVIGNGSWINTVTVVSHPVESVINTAYVPAHRSMACGVVWLLGSFHTNV